MQDQPVSALDDYGDCASFYTAAGDELLVEEKLKNDKEKFSKADDLDCASLCS